VFICQSYDQKTKWLFLEHSVFHQRTAENSPRLNLSITDFVLQKNLKFLGVELPGSAGY